MSNRFIKQVNGQFQEELTVVTSAGAGSAGKVPELNAAGKLDLTLVDGAAVGGAGAANKVGLLDASGKFDQSMMPVGVAPDFANIQATEAISAGAMVNIYNVTGAARMRLADAASNKPAHGFAPSAVANGATGSVTFEGRVSGLSGLTPGPLFLGANGAPTSTATTTAGQLLQPVGTAISATEFNFARFPGIVIA